VATVVFGGFEWDDEKAAANLENHEGVSFPEAATAIDDPNANWRKDEASTDEERFLVLGMSALENVLLVVTTERGERERIIGAWRATLEEERLCYGENRD
jgi:uncharacterized DUF497 family protein